jgi:hypothetical protein
MTVKIFEFDIGGRYRFEIVFNTLWGADELNIRSYNKDTTGYNWYFFKTVDGKMNWTDILVQAKIRYLHMPEEMKSFVHAILRMKAFW